MASGPQTPAQAYSSVPQPDVQLMHRGYGSRPNTGVADFAQGNPNVSSPLSQSMGNGGARQEDFRDNQGGSSILNEGEGLDSSASTTSTAVPHVTPARQNTLKKKSSINRKSSLRRIGSRNSLKAGSIKGVVTENHEPDFNSAFYTPIPTQGSPTEVLANRFNAWRELLKSLITYFREIQSSYDHRSKAISKVHNTLQNIQHPSVFITNGGLGDATRILAEYHKHSITEATKSRDIENDVISALTGLRSDLGQKIKEIKSLSGDFKNTVDKEKEGTKKAVAALDESLAGIDHGDGGTGKKDPFVVRLAVDRMIERQIDEENYLHRAYLNLESSGRELESIVVGEIQKAYNALAGLLKREADDAHNTVEGLRSGPIAMPKEQEWTQFVESDPHFVNPRLPLRRIEDIDYPGRNHPAAAEIRAGMLERKSKYLKSYTPCWYVLSPTHLHEFKSADKIYSQPPIMSLYLPDQKLGSKSDSGSSSHKFMLKGSQTGSIHRGHSWVFRAESHDTMLAWFEDIKALTEKSGPEREAFVRKHTRSVSGNNERPRSMSSDGMEEDEADEVPYSAKASVRNQGVAEPKPLRPAPGGRFPSDLHVPRQAPLSPSSGSSEPDRDAASNAMTGSSQQEFNNQSRDRTNPYELEGIATGTGVTAGAAGTAAFENQQRRQPNFAEDVADRNVAFNQQRSVDGPGRSQDDANSPPKQAQGSVVAQPQQRVAAPVQTQTYALDQQQQPMNQIQPRLSSRQVQPRELAQAPSPRHNSQYGDWMAPAAAGMGAGAISTEAYKRHQQQSTVPEAVEPAPSVPERSQRCVSAPPSPVAGLNATSFGNNRASNSTVPSMSAASASTAPTEVTAGSGIAALGGLEQEGAHETGEFFPRVVRHDTNMSISKLHVPGEFPKKI